MAPGPDGSLVVAIPRPRGAVLTLLDRTGAARPGWPIALPYSTACGYVAAADDGSVRAVCDATDRPASTDAGSFRRAFAFGPDAVGLPGWPVAGPFSSVAGLDGDALVVLSVGTNGDPANGSPSGAVWLTTIDRDGTVRDGARVSVAEGLVHGWTVGPHAIAYGTRVRSGPAGASADTDTSEVLAIDAAGIRPGWPVTVAGTPGVPVVLADGRVALTIGFLDREASRVLVLDGTGTVAGGSPELPLATARVGPGCGLVAPDGPIVADDGTMFVASVSDSRIFGLDSDLQPLPGWPYAPPRDRLSLDPLPCPSGGPCCEPPASVRPAAGRGGSLYLPLEPGSPSRGGGLLAVGRRALPVDGWPVELRRPGAGFWSVVVGPDGTAHALALEPASGEDTSATILAIATDGSVRYRATVVEP